MKTISIVIPCHNEHDSLRPLFERLDRVFSKASGYRFEIVCVNDGSSDQTLDGLIGLAAERADIVVVDLSRNFGKEAALSAGLKVASGDAVVPMDADLQDPPDLLIDMISKWEHGHEVVLARRSDRSSDAVSKRWSARVFYRFHNQVADVAIPPDVGDFRLMDRAVVEVVNSLPESRRFMKGLFAWAGFRTITIDYQREPRAAGESSFNAWRLWNLALEGITSFSTAPLRVWTYLGVFVAAIAMLWASWITIRTLVHGVDVPGYASLFVAVLFLGGLQLIGIGVIGEYLGRTYIESKGRPAYVIRKIYRRDD